MAAIFEVLKDCVPQTSKDKEPKIEKEELKEDLSLTAKPEKTTSFNRKTVITAIIVLGVIFASAFVYGISTASNQQKKTKNKEVQPATASQHLQNVPGNYGDSKNGGYSKTDDKTKKIQRPTESEYEQQPSQRQTSSYTPSYTPIPHSTYTPSYAPSYTPVPQQTQHSSGGMTMEDKIASEKAKEKMTANQSQISFGIKEENQK